MICVSLAEESLDACFAALRNIDFAEIRLDKMNLSADDTRMLFSAHRRLIATCRPGSMDDERRKRLLIAAIDAGAAYVDVEVDSHQAFRDYVVSRARSRGCTVIVSFHDYEKTPRRRELEASVTECLRARADIVKISTMVRSARDNARLLGLLDRPEKIVVIGMGEMGRITRIVAPLLGSPFTFASASPGRETAEGQIDEATLRNLMRIAHIEAPGKVPL